MGRRASVSTRLGRDRPPGCRGRGTVEDLGGPRRERVSSASQCGAAHPLPGSAARTADIAGCRARCLDRRTRTSNGPRRTSPPAAISGWLRASHIDTAYMGVEDDADARVVRGIQCRLQPVEVELTVFGLPGGRAIPKSGVASEVIIREAMRDDPRPLFVALRQVVFDSGIPIWQVPRSSYRQALMSFAEPDTRVRPHGPLILPRRSAARAADRAPVGLRAGAAVERVGHRASAATERQRLARGPSGRASDA